MKKNIPALLILALLSSTIYAEADEQRPIRQKPVSPPDYIHQAEFYKSNMDFPWGEAEFEKFRTAYLSNGGKEWIAAVYRRSLPYISLVLERLRHYNMPYEFFYLPFIESEYLPKAVSKSGAMGLWQFMRNSIAGYDMVINDWVDERSDFIKSTDAALRKLLWNYEHFGDWLLALAAYNCGAGAMDRAITKTGSRDYWELRRLAALPSETASYIPKFLALVSVAGQTGRNFLPSSWDGAEEWLAIPLDRPVDIAMLAEISGLSLDLLKKGNPELKYMVTPPEGRYSIKVPVAMADAVRTALASGEKLLNVYIHMVKSGDTVSAIARHYGVSIPMIVNLNPGLNPDKIRLGQNLAIPAFRDVQPYYNDASQDRALKFTGRYTVKKGDTLWSISLLYGVQPEVLAEKNGMDLSSILPVDYSLIVPILE